MALAVSILTWMVLAVLAALLAAVLLPVRLRLQAAVQGGVRVSATLSPFWSIGPRIPLRGGRHQRDADTPRKTPAGRRTARRLPGPHRIIRPVIRLLRDVLRQVHVHEAAVDLTFGSDDPAETGEIYGLLTPLIFGGHSVCPIGIRLNPVFDRAAFCGHAVLDVSLIPARLLPPVLRFGWAAFGPGR